MLVKSLCGWYVCKQSRKSTTVSLWPNGEGIGLLSQGLWVRVPPGAFLFCFLIFLDGRVSGWGRNRLRTLK